MITSMEDMTLNERIVNRMLNWISDFEFGRISTSRLLECLEGSIDAMEPSLSSEDERDLHGLLGHFWLAVELEEKYYCDPSLSESTQRLRAFLQPMSAHEYADA